MGTETFNTSGLAATTQPTAVASHASAHTKGNWVEIEDSTTVACDGFWLYLASPGSAIYNFLFDLSTGAAGDEANHILISNLLCGSDQYGAGANVYFIPIAIAASTRISARCSNTTGGKNGLIQISYVHTHLGTGPMTGGVGTPFSVGGVTAKPLTTITTYGITEAATKPAANVDPGGTAHTKGSYQLLGTLSADARALVFAFAPNPTSQVYGASARYRMDVATGEAGAESIKIPDVSFMAFSAGNLPPTILLPMYFASGTKISVRLQCSINTANTCTLDTCFYAFN